MSPPGPSSRVLLRDAWCSYLRILWLTCLLASLCGIYVRTFLVQAFQVPSDSMQPTLLVGDRILVNKFIFSDLRAGSEWTPPWLPSRLPRRGDVVVAVSPRRHQYLVKRAIGLPGEQLEMSQGQLFVDRAQVEETYLHTAHPDDGSIEATSIPLDRYFLLGDHRSGSVDSRVWGALPARHLVGQAFVIYWSDAAFDVADPDRLISTRDRLSWLQRYRWERLMRPVR